MKKYFLIVSLLFVSDLFSQNIREKKICRTDAVVKITSTIYLLPFYYETGNTTDNKILAMVDTLPRQNFIMRASGQKIYSVLSKEDTNKIAISVTEVSNPLTPKFGIIELWGNGNFKRVYTYDRKYRLAGIMENHENSMIKLIGDYRKGKKIGKWTYFNDDGDIVRKEKYKNGVLESTKEYPTPKKTLRTRFLVKREEGTKYTLN